MNPKFFELRDRATFIPVVAVLMEPHHEGVPLLPPVLREQRDRERYLIRRAGFNCERKPGWPRDVILCRLEAKGTDRNATYDEFAWGDRTFYTAHAYICKHWDELQSGAVIDVEFILGERETPKESEMTT